LIGSDYPPNFRNGRGLKKRRLVEYPQLIISSFVSYSPNPTDLSNLLHLQLLVLIVNLSTYYIEFEKGLHQQQVF